MPKLNEIKVAINIVGTDAQRPPPAATWSPPWESNRNIDTTGEETRIAMGLTELLRSACGGDTGKAERVILMMHTSVILTKIDQYRDLSAPGNPRANKEQEKQKL